MSTSSLSRRKFIASSLLLTTVSPFAFGNENKIVFNGWTAQQLSDQVNQTSYLPSDFRKFLEDFSANSARSRSQFPPKTFSYGTSSGEKLDVFAPSNAKDLPVMIFIHGGAWTFGSKDDYSAAAPTFMNANAIYVAIGFDNIPPNNMPGIVGQCRKAIGWIAKNIRQLGGDPNKLYISGHSSGGHMANMMACTNWEKMGLAKNLLKGVVVMSGWTDLHPISLSDRQEYLKLTPAQIKEFSPINLINNVNCPMIISWGALESPYMQMQSSSWAKQLQSVGRLAGVYRVAGHNHLQMPGLFNSANNELTKATLALMDIA